MNVAGRNERVDTRTLGVFERLCRPLDIQCVGARKRRHLHPLELPADGVHGFEVAF